MARMYRVGGVVVLLSLAGCGSSTKTVTVHEAKAQPPAAKVVKQPRKPSTRTCSAGISANAHASCPFAERILAAYAAHGETRGMVYLGVESPTTHKGYSVACGRYEKKWIACHATNAEVTLSFDAINKAEGKHPAPAPPPMVVSGRPSGLYGGQTRAENEEAGCKYGFIVQGLKPNGESNVVCNTQETGRRIQEAFRREREHPQREAENARLGAEAQAHEECVVQLGVAACP